MRAMQAALLVAVLGAVLLPALQAGGSAAAAAAVARRGAANDIPPVVLMHGILGSRKGLDQVVAWIEAAFPGLYVRNMEIGDGVPEIDSITIPMNRQIELFCQAIYADANLKRGFNLIGFSQGGLVARGYIERCNKFPVINFLSWASPQMGVFGMGYVPDFLTRIIHSDMYLPEIQNSVTFAQYWKDPYRYNEYLEKSLFLPDLNNERAVKNETYKQNIMALNKFLMIYSPRDDVLVPPVSGWFGFFRNDSGPLPEAPKVPLQESQMYLQDWIGLRHLDENGRLEFHTTNCTHIGHNHDECEYAFTLYTLPILSEPFPSIRAFWKRNNLFPHLW